MPLNASPASAGPRPHLESSTSSSAVHLAPQQDAEMDMMDTGHSPPPDHDESAQASALLHDRSTGRMPTPIQPSFAVQVRGQQNGWAAGGQAQLAPNGVANLGHHVTGLSHDQAIPRAMACEADWQILHNNRRLPSPISEIGDLNVQSASDGQGCMMVDGQEQFAQQGQVSPVHDSMSGQVSPMHAMEHPNAMIDADSHHHHGESDTDPSSPSPNRRGHQRSKHTVNSWTWQPGMKKSFSIGYRSDCEKCRLKVPGHFNHIVIS